MLHLIRTLDRSHGCSTLPAKEQFVMPNINSVVNEQIRRLARREIRSSTRSVKKATAHYRRDIAALKRQVATLTKNVKDLQKQEEKRGGGLPLPENTEGLRFRADGL